MDTKKRKTKLYKKGRLGLKQMELKKFKPTKPRKTYPQQWHEYNLSQTSEKLMFMNILQDITQYIRYRKPPKKGRPQQDLTEMIYCLTLHTYCGKSTRRTISELHQAKTAEHIKKVPHFNTLLNYYKNPQITTLLQSLIQLSSHPLKNIEEDFAVDSSGFTTSTFARWKDYKWGKQEGKERIWRKAHVMSGVKTNIITSIEIINHADTTQFQPLVQKTNETFKIREVSADKAYSSRKNLQTVSNIGGVAYIPFKKGSRRKSKGCLAWSRMMDYFFDHQEDFLSHYHKRSNAETVFSMIKRKFSNNLRTKTPLSQTNEILCKALAHNIVVLIHETFELGISTDWQELYSDLRLCAEANPAQKTS